MGNIIENIQEVRLALDGLFSSMSYNGLLTTDEKKVIESVERKMAEVQTEAHTFFSGKI